PSHHHNLHSFPTRRSSDLSSKASEEHKRKKEGLVEQLTDSLSNVLLGEKIPLDVVNAKTGEIIIPANRKITKTLLRKLATAHDQDRKSTRLNSSHVAISYA